MAIIFPGKKMVLKIIPIQITKQRLKRLKPSTLNLIPYTINFKPYTLNLTP